MTNLIVASFNQEAEATEASHKLHELESIGDITIYEMIVIKKSAEGETAVVEVDTTAGSTTLSGMAIGSLIGALAGPVGLVAGMMTGTMTGAVLEADDYGFAEDFIARVSEELQPGMVAVVAELDEDSQVFVDSTLTPLGGTLTRTDVDYEYNKYSDEELDDLEEDIAAKRAKLQSAAAEDKAKFQQKLTDLKERRNERISKLKEKISETVAGIKTSGKERKIAKIRNKIEKHQKKIAELEKDLQEILEKGKEAVKEVEG